MRSVWSPVLPAPAVAQPLEKTPEVLLQLNLLSGPQGYQYLVQEEEAAPTRVLVVAVAQTEVRLPPQELSQARGWQEGRTCPSRTAASWAGRVLPPLRGLPPWPPWTIPRVIVSARPPQPPPSGTSARAGPGRGGAQRRRKTPVTVIRV